MHKLSANAVFYPVPSPHIYSVLPPPRSEFEDVLAFIYIGPSKPTDKEYQRIPLLVRRNKVAQALQWLKNNDIDYADLTISKENLDTYEDGRIPVDINYCPSGPDTQEANVSIDMQEDANEPSTELGDCPFIVHGLDGNELPEMTTNQLRGLSLAHLAHKGKVLGIGHDDPPMSIYKNPQLYPQIFPWLFPYGLGGLGTEADYKTLGERLRKHNLLMYHDK
ncbi:hypothetical protein OF83DRAFT_1031841, partial [Amylostereum chailletii]